MATLAAKGASITAREDLLWPVAGTATVDVVDAGGTPVATAVDATYDPTESLWMATLEHGQTAVPGLLTLTWTHSDGDTATSTVDVRDGNPYPLAALKRFTDRGNGTYTTAARMAALADALTMLEKECGVRFVTQRTVVTVRAAGSTQRVAHHRVTGVPSHPDATVTAGGNITFTSSLAIGDEFTIDHGFPALDRDAARAVAMLASAMLADGPWDDRGAAVGEGGTMVRLLTAGVGGAKFSIPEVQAFYKSRRVVLVR